VSRRAIHGRALAPDPPDHTVLTPVTIAGACAGLVCGSCGTGFAHPPCSNYWSDRDETVIHVPAFMALRWCGVCGARDWIQAHCV
jgi:hypothetical protein